MQLRLRDGPGVRAPASHSVTEGVTVGSAISLFSGAGGLDLGIESAGFAILAAVGPRSCRSMPPEWAGFTTSLP